jgi:hypothetical protein
MFITTYSLVISKKELNVLICVLRPEKEFHIRFKIRKVRHRYVCLVLYPAGVCNIECLVTLPMAPMAIAFSEYEHDRWGDTDRTLKGNAARKTGYY